MDYNNGNLDPDVLEFYCPNKTKNIRCHPHHHMHPQNPQRMQVPGGNQQPIFQGPFKHTHVSYVAPSGAGFADASKNFQRAQIPQQMGSSEHFHVNQRCRSSASPAQALHGACGSGASTLTSSSGFCSGTSGSMSAGSGAHVGHKATTSLRAIDLIKLLREKIALLPGGRSRQGGPILCFPSNSRSDEIPFGDLCLLVWYLAYLPEERVKKLGFCVIVDMRNGTTWHSVKPILKVVEKCIGQNVAMTYIIKPDKLFEKHKAQMAIGKFSFEIQLVSLDTLFREVDPSQLTADLEGSLPYQHEEWIKIRCCLEEFFLFAQDMSDKFSQLFCFLERKPEPTTVEEAKRALEEHRSVRLKIVQAPVSALEAEADRLVAWLRYGISATASVAGGNQAATGGSQSYAGSVATAAGPGGAGGAAFLATSWVSMNPDFQQLIPQVRQTVSKLYEFRAHLQQKWEAGRSRLEQIHQLRLFDEDASRMASWLAQQRHLFLTEYLDIGQTASHAADLHAEHRQFLAKCTTVREQVARLNGVAGMLADGGHFASQQILKQAGQLEHEWKSFTAALEDRSRVLYLSASFHARAQSFLANCPHREAAMRQVNGTTVHELNQALLTLQNYWQEVQSAHEEVCADGRALANHLSAPVPTGSHTSLTAAVDYSQGRKHCTDLVHEIWAWYKQLERVFTDRRRRLTARLSLLMFKEDVGQVLAWLSEHGEPFLQRQTAVGKSIQRAEQLYNAHMQFEQVAANTLTNAEKLISAADELAAQADDPEEILQEANELQRRISAFTRAVETRRETLDLGCGFYSHTKEVLAWLHGVRESHNCGEHLPATIEGMEDELTNFHRDRAAIEEGADRVATEGEALVARLKDTEEISHLRSVLAQVSSERSAVSSLLTERQVRLDLCLQLRLFEADVHSALDCLRHGVPSLSNVTTVTNRSDTSNTTSSSGVSVGSTAIASSSPNTPQQQQQPQNYLWLSDPKQAPDVASLEEVSSACMSVLPTAEEVLNKGGELARAFDSVGVNFPAGGPGSSDSGVGDSVETAVERVHRLIGELAEAVTAVDELNERIVAELDWRRLQVQSRQVLHWIGQCEDILRETAVIPASLAEAEALQADHEKFQPVLNDAHPQAVQCAARASYLLQQSANSSGIGLSTSTTVNEHPRRKDYQNVAETVANRWQKLVYAAEERHKLLIAATNWYKTSDQVTSVLWSLEREYHREEDWCQNEKAVAGGDAAAYLNQLSLKHAEQKEAFLKACMLARRTSDVFSRYLHRQPSTTTGRLEAEDKIRAAMSELMAKEQAVLEAWAVRRRRLDDCTYFINIKRQVEELLTRVQSQLGNLQSSNKTQLGSSLIQEVTRACESLNSMITAPMPLSSGHTAQLKVLLSRLHATLPQSSVGVYSTTPAVGASGDASSPKPGTEGPKQQVSVGEPRKASSVTTRLDLPGANRTKRLDVDTDRTSVSSTSSSGAGSTGTSVSDVFLGSGSASETPGPTPEQRRIIRRRENLLRELIQTERTYIQSLEQCIETYRKGLINPPKALESQIPAGLVGKVETVFGNIPAIYEFHKQRFEPELRKYTESGGFLPEDVGHCFVVHSERLAELYVEYCVNNTKSTRLVIECGQNFFQSLQHYLNLIEPLQSYLIKPVQRVTKYQLLLRELRDCCEPASVAELNEGLEAMLNVPKRANDALHLSMLQNLPEDLPMSSLGDVILQEQFTVWEPKQLIKKSRERRVFLFDNCLILAKEQSTQPGEHEAKYHYKSRLLLAECNITEHIEGDQCKFALWTGRVPPIHEYRMVLKATTLELKQTWVRALREVMRERMFSVQSLYQHQQGGTAVKSGVFSDDAELLDTYYILENYQATSESELSVSAHQIVQLLHRCSEPNLSSTMTAAGEVENGPKTPIGDESGDSGTLKMDPNGAGDWAYIRVLVHGTANSTQSPIKEGFIPARLLGAPSGRRRTGTTNVSGNRRSSTTVRKWLPAGSRRGGAGGTPGKRGSKADLHQSQILSTPYPTSAPKTVSERPTPQLSNSRNGAAAQAELGTILDNVSEESVDVELPPPMSELQVLPATVPEADKGSSDREPPDSGFGLSDEDGKARDKANSLEINGSAMQPSELEEQLDKSAKIPHRPAVVPEVAGDGRTDMSNVPTLIGLPGGSNLSGLGDLRLHGGLNVAAKLVPGSRPSPLNTLNQNAKSSTPKISPQDEEMLRGILDEGTELHFVNRYLFLYDHALVIADAAVELLMPDEEAGQEKTPPKSQPKNVQCHFRHALPISQISILEDFGVPGTKPTGDQLLWFCLSERARYLGTPFDSSLATGGSPQSYLCYIVAPRSPDTRIRWLTELTSMVMEARRLSQAMLSGAGPSSLEGGGGNSPGDFGPNGTGDSGMQLRMSSVTTAALYPSGLLFDPSLLELPKLGRIQVSGVNSDSRCKSANPKPSDQVVSTMLESLHLTVTSSS